MTNIQLVHPESFLQEMEEVEKGNLHVAHIQSKDFLMQQKFTEPLIGYRHPEGFPDCCGFHIAIFKRGLEKYLAFPDCCAGHQKLTGARWFNKAAYTYLPSKLVTTVSFTQHAIQLYLDRVDWYKEITDYIHYTMASYGQFPDGYGSPLGLSEYVSNVATFIESLKDIPAGKRTSLLAILHKKESKAKEMPDLNLLIDQYKEWMELFPFHLSLFKPLKPYFENRLPLLKGAGDTNRHTGLTCFQLKTPKELMAFLVDTTRIITKEINTVRLYKEGRLEDTDRLHLDIIVANRELQLQQDEALEFPDKKEYVQLVQKWLHEEKNFLAEITPLLSKRDPVFFLKDILMGIRLLQKNDTNEPCLMNIRNNGSDKESLFRYWFKNFFSSRYGDDAVVTAEEQKGNGHIDLRVVHPSFSDKIIEFKGWWNSDKAQTPEQICGYLTDFEKEGYIVMINDCKSKDITDAYKALITNPALQYFPSSWVVHTDKKYEVSYYESQHQFEGKIKTVYHFVFNVYF